ncbi:hypothetical protein SKTS_12760 [Sulfurimicrobium lacus]|uniref:Flagellar hook-associated protein 2 C-terminal domain-containing protein n=1 Tax=Sulfurimicrobium lacus TaxID=2715678 RepID=A0A6F8VAN4_9PROT|nr:flagellar filament capping protein FliD [Sulfurimicrobium lacus]BCB26390.1 hypothetical protein SKTS_12760 [Sulfurimicrobium lacus]
MNISPASIALNLATFRSQALGTLMSSAPDSGKDAFAALMNQFSTANDVSTDPLSWLAANGSVAGVAAPGRNMALVDPESAFRMMSVINQADVDYKARFAELSEMKAYVAQMQDAGQSLGNITPATGNDSIASQLQGFVAQYNGWVQRFDPDMQNGGILAGTQAAQVSRYELGQSIANIFNGAKDGVHGLRDLGVSIDRNTGLATLDTAKLDAILAGNKQGAVDALQEFSANFAKSANLLNSGGNFIPNQLDNLNRAIHYIADNESSLQAEFGSGDAPKATGLVAQALAAYNRTYAI